MNTFSSSSAMRAIGTLLVITLFTDCKKEQLPSAAVQRSSEEASIKPGADNITALSIVQSQTKTATYLNNLNNFRQVFGDQGYPRAKAEFVSADDGIYGSTSKLSAKGNSSSILALQGFGFTIPSTATIQDITIRLKRFKTGSPAIGDRALSLMQRFDCGAGPCTYGVFWTYLDVYPGRMYPTTETEYFFSQAGSGSTGGFSHNQAYLWTPAIVNHQYFGVRIDSHTPSGTGTVVINYDVVEVTVKYTTP